MDITALTDDEAAQAVYDGLVKGLTAVPGIAVTPGAPPNSYWATRNGADVDVTRGGAGTWLVNGRIDPGPGAGGGALREEPLDFWIERLADRAQVEVRLKRLTAPTYDAEQGGPDQTVQRVVSEFVWAGGGP